MKNSLTTTIITEDDERHNIEVDRNRMLRAAVGYAKLLNWHIFPVHSIIKRKCTCGRTSCSKGKHPITRNGVKDATSNLDIIRNWWEQFPFANIGVATGKISGFFVLDVDVGQVDGKATLESLESEHNALPDTVQAITGSGGLHFLFKYQEGIGNKASFEPGLDIRGDGGYIVVSPSNHESGNSYQWELSSHPLENDIADAPEWLIKMIVQLIQVHGENIQVKPSSHWQKLMQGLSEGEGRNPAAASLAGHLFAKRIDPLLVVEIMNLWNERNSPPLEQDELNTVINSIAGKELERRRRRKW